MAKGIFIELDCLLDTRLALLYAIDPTNTSNIIDSNSYSTRKKDNFNNISNDIFKPLYRHRSKQLLSLATPTNLMSYILPHIADLKHDFKTLANETRDYTVFINVYPYVLNMDEILALEDLYYTLFNTNTINGSRNLIKLVSMDTEELSPEWIDVNVESLVLYSGMEWIEYHTSNLNLMKIPLIGVTLTTPAIVEMSVNSNTINSDFFRKVTETMKGLIIYQPIPVSYFCSLLAKK
jgi:hypothetical protein